MRIRRGLFVGWVLQLVLVLLVGNAWGVQAAGVSQAGATADIIGPVGSGSFGAQVVVLPSGNIVITDPTYDDGDIQDVGAVYLYNGRSHAQISMLKGTTSNDRVGFPGVVVLSNGNYVIRSPYWANGAATQAGAITWGSGSSGVSGVVSATNSLVGSTASDLVGITGVTTLSNGNYVVSSPIWDNGLLADAGAVTWGSGSSGVSGVISKENSLVGSTTDDQVGSSVIPLSSGNYVVRSPFWDNGTTADAGAATWGSGTEGIRGVVSEANSLVGSTAGDQIGYYNVTPLSNGSYVVSSPNWDNGTTTDAGAATWGSGSTGSSGVVSAANSLVGSTAYDMVSYSGVTALSNGNYVVGSLYWNNGAAAQAGAATWGSGSTGVSGAVSEANSLVGSTTGDQVGSHGVTALSNGNYVVSSPFWANGAVAEVGAATWGSGTEGIRGVISAANSLVGSTANDQVGLYGVAALSNGNYVVRSPNWHNEFVADVGAATWGNGSTGSSGAVSAANSLVGSTTSDRVGSGVTALSNGNYVVRSPFWDNGSVVNVGAATWGSGTAGVSGVVSAANSLVGSTADDRVSYSGVRVLSNGNYVVGSLYWNNGTATQAGAATWGSGTQGIRGVVSAANSLVGSTTGDQVGSGVTALSGGNYVVGSPFWDNGSVVNVGAATWGNGSSGSSGAVSAANSLVGSTANDRVSLSGVTALSGGNYVVGSPYWDNGTATDAGAISWDNWNGVSGILSTQNSVFGLAANGGGSMNWAYDQANAQLVIARPAENLVTLVKILYAIRLPIIQKN